MKRQTPWETTQPAPGGNGDSKAASRANQAELIENLLGKVEQKLANAGDVKASVADYIRLVQLYKELQDDEPRDIEVKWIDPQKQDEDPSGGA
jgi:hypothetical protein